MGGKSTLFPANLPPPWRKATGGDAIMRTAGSAGGRRDSHKV